MQGKFLPCPGCERLLTVPPDTDIPKQVVELPDPDEVVVTDDDITFDCVHCEYLLVADKSGAGKIVKCPGCGRPVTIPKPRKQSPSAKAASAGAESAVTWKHT